LDAAAINSELSKLSLLADPAGRLPDKTVTLAAQTQELGIFELLRAVQLNNQSQAVWRRILEDRLSGENMVFAFISILLREGRILWQLLNGESPYLPYQAAAGKQILAKSLGHARIARIWDLALQADKGIKTGERSPEQSFEILTADLFTLFQGLRRP
jgi:DNA polymerase-3 subunit delta